MAKARPTPAQLTQQIGQQTGQLAQLTSPAGIAQLEQQIALTNVLANLEAQIGRQRAEAARAQVERWAAWAEGQGVE